MHTRSGADVRMRADHRPGDVHIPGRNMDIHHGLNGNRRVEIERADHSRLVADHRGGHIERPYRFGNHEFARRTFYEHGRPYERFYGRYQFRGVNLNVYRPAAYYRPEFYGWAYNPWTPVHYAWAPSPAVAYYGVYFAPAPVYPTPSLWLTDYLVATSLAAAYQASVDANTPPPPQPVYGSALSPQAKDLIAQEVQRQIALENSEVQTSVPNGAEQPAPGIERDLTDNTPHVFVAGAEVDLVDSTGNECAITEGDALEMNGAPASDAVAADLLVLASKGGKECRSGATVSVAIADLQEMQNHMRAMIDQGLGELRAKQGTGGLPAIPNPANAPPVKAAFVSTAPPPDKNVATELQQQVAEADTAEAQVLGEAQQTSGPSADSAVAANPAPAPGPATIALGQTINQIVAVEGNPKSVADLGFKKIYIFNDGLRVTFMAGKSVNIR
jgi:hypothetical protein